MESWAIYRHESNGRLQYLDVITAKDSEHAFKEATELLPEEDPEKLRVKPWTGTPERGTA